MAETLQTYIENVQNEVDDTSSAALLVITRGVKETYQEVLRQLNPYLVGTLTEENTAVVGQKNYTTANEVESLRQVAYKTENATKFNSLKEISLQDYLDNHIDDENGTPNYYFVDGTVINISPAPVDNGTVRIVYRPITPELTGTSILPERYTRVITLGACYRFFAYEKGPEAENYKAWYEQSLRDILMELSTRESVIRPNLY